MISLLRVRTVLQPAIGIVCGVALRHARLPCDALAAVLAVQFPVAGELDHVGTGVQTIREGIGEKSDEVGDREVRIRIVRVRVTHVHAAVECEELRVCFRRDDLGIRVAVGVF